VREGTDLPVALDESVRGPADAAAAIRVGAADLFVIKLMKSGGITAAREIAAIAERAGIGILVGNMGESSLGLAAHLHLAAVLGGATRCDADVPWRPGGLARDIGRGLATERHEGVSVVVVPRGPGLGIEIDDEAVVAQRATRPWHERTAAGSPARQEG